MNKFLIIALLGGSAVVCAAQTNRFPPINLYTGDPTGNVCSGNLIQQSSTTGLLYTCQSGHMAVGGTTGSGTVTGQASGIIPLAGGSTLINAQSHLDDGVTAAGTITASEHITTAAGKTVNVASQSIPVGFSSGILAYPASYNPNVAVDVRAAGARGDSVTDDTVSIKLACTTARLSSPPKVVYLPVGNYLTDDLSPECMGVSFSGQAAGMGLAVGGYAATLIGKPGKDVLHVPDPTTTGYFNPNRSWVIENVTIQVDDSVDLNNRTATDGVTNGTTTITSATMNFVSGDVGKYITIAYADTTRDVRLISGFTNSTTVTLSTATSESHTAVSFYIPLDSPGFPHRWPGRWVQDAAMTSGSSVLTTTKAQITCGDVGQWVVVKGAGAAGADLVAQIPALPLCTSSSPTQGLYTATSIDLGVAAGTTVSGALLYVAVNNLGPYEQITNCAMAWDFWNGSTSIAGKANSYPIMRNVTIDSKSGLAHNHTCGMYFQTGVWTPYGIDATQLNIFRVDYGIVEGTADTNPGLVSAGQDFQTWRHMAITGVTNPFIFYNGVGRIEDTQLAGPNGYDIISVTTAVEVGAFGWDINIPEFEQNVGSPTVLATGGAWIHNTTLGRHAFIAGKNNICSNCIVQSGASNTISVTGLQNDVGLYQSLDVLTTSVNGPTNRIIGNTLNSQTSGARKTMISNGRTALAGEKNAAFVRWNPSAPFNNLEDIWLWPQDMKCHAVANNIVADPTSESGYYLQSSLGGGCLEDFWYNLKIPALGLNGLPVIGGANPVLGASKYQLVAKIACPVAASFTLSVKITTIAGANVTTINLGSQPCSTGYTTIKPTVDLTPYGGGVNYVQTLWPGTAEIRIAWEAWRALPEDIPMLTGNSGTTIPASVIPAPGGGTNTNLGGIQSRSCTTGQHISTIGTDGSVTCSVDGGGVSTVPLWLQFYGDGSEGAYAPVGTVLLEGEHWYSSVNIAAGVTVRPTHTYPVIIRSTGTCTIAGTLGSSINLGAGGTAGNGYWAGSGGGGGGGTGVGTAGSNGFSGVSADKGTAGTAGGGAGGTGPGTVAANANFQKVFLSQGLEWFLSPPAASGPGGAQGGAGGSSGGAGGLGGGEVVLVCPTINFTGTIDVSGGAGGASTGNNIGAGGGGGGGIVIIRSPALTNSGTINTSGGTGGSCGAFTGCGAGGNGGSGWSAVFSQ